MARTLAHDRYVIERRIGNGGMATVYLARDPKLGRTVAVKLLADNFAEDDVARRRFEREARLAAKLDHPNVVRVFDVGEDEGRPFIVMEHVDGGTLADLTRRRRPPRKRALGLLAQACAGLGHAHREGLVHRDVKPQNLLLSRGDGRLKIADFGIARAVEEAGITRTGFVLGTQPYMAPEQLAGGKLTPATDVYALGVVARELLGERLPSELDGLIERCLSKDPRRRPADARELGKALERLDGDEPITAERTTVEAPPPPRTRSSRTTRPLPAEARDPDRRRALIALGGGAAILLTALALIVGSGGGSGESGDGGGEGAAREPEPAPRLEDPAQQGRAFADWLRERSR
jgi:serine/threonine-protein kinase